VQFQNVNLDEDEFNSWWGGRKIPASRDGAKEVLLELRDAGGLPENVRIAGLEELAEKSWGLSLSDQYWIRPHESVTWAEVNFFTNEFSDDIGELLMSGRWQGTDLYSPDNTSDGVIKKRWKIITGSRRLLKGSYGPPWYAQPSREVLASKIARVMMKPLSPRYVVPYSIMIDVGLPYSVCPNFVTPDTEYVNYYQFRKRYSWLTDAETYTMCRGLYEAKVFVLDIMLMLDYIILNEDRHMGNFGFIRCVNTGKVLEPAPIFDTGNALFFDKESLDVTKIGSRPFEKTFKEQIKLVPVEKYQESLNSLQSNIIDIFYESFVQSKEDETRKEALLGILRTRIKELIEMSKTQKPLSASGAFTKPAK
jgi:hypothetical protein